MSNDPQLAAVRKFFTYLHGMLRGDERWHTGSTGAVVMPNYAHKMVPEFLLSLRNAAPLLYAVEGLIPERRRDLDDLLERCIGSTVSVSVDKQMLRGLIAEAKLFQDAIRRCDAMSLTSERLAERIAAEPPPPSQQTYDLLDSANNTITMAHATLTTAGIEDIGNLNARLQKLIDHKGGLSAPVVGVAPGTSEHGANFKLVSAKKDVTPHSDLVRGYEAIITAKDQEIASLKERLAAHTVP